MSHPQKRLKGIGLNERKQHDCFCRDGYTKILLTDYIRDNCHAWQKNGSTAQYSIGSLRFVCFAGESAGI